MYLGCTKKVWKFNVAGLATNKHILKPAGELLEDGACVDEDYSKDFLPVEKRP